MVQQNQDKKGFNIRFTRNRIIFILALSVVAFIILYYYFFVPKPITSVQYGNYILNFRADLREAKKVPVYPTEDALYREMMHDQVQNITIALKPANKDENSYYILEIYELLYPKLPLAYSSLKLSPNFTREPLIVDSYENLSGKINNPIIALVHPIYSDETSIRVDDHIVIIKGKTPRDFDLAVDKFLMVALGIDV